MGDWERDRWCWSIAWRRERRGRERDEEELLMKLLGKVRIKIGGDDGWRWVHDSKGNYVVKKAYEFLAPLESVLQGQLCRLVWCNLVPSKVSFFGWRLCLDRLPTKGNLYKRGVDMQEGSLMCSFCNEAMEEIDHLFCTCKEVWLLWAKVLNWWGAKSVLPNSVAAIAEFFWSSFGRLVGKEMGACMFLIVSWYLWYWRNAVVFQNNGSFKEKLLDMVQIKSFLGLNLRILAPCSPFMNGRVPQLLVHWRCGGIKRN
ncbi:hypothetical protein SLEP1_g56341 [Rubroshorea leprosula]|uniref:Reverse transcriptase zinc-binding domain-containing protein n=1 Tax=Rubroshorea leprosula TaxID=152421 RepID=A0AAV5MLC0_9ROSI|nr:hypothetical protein SLEP1_g56341 [Rubroshorea leprosula]